MTASGSRGSTLQFSLGKQTFTVPGRFLFQEVAKTSQKYWLTNPTTVIINISASMLYWQLQREETVGQKWNKQA